MNNEDIKVLEEYKEKMIKDERIHDDYRNMLTAIENLIERNKAQKDNIDRLLEIIKEETIPKSKVREKIEELEKFIESKRILPVDIIEDQNRNVKWKIEVLQELLEERND